MCKIKKTPIHGHYVNGRASPTYMLARCSHEYTNGFHNYGGRGIKVCERWKIFENFLSDMGERPIDKTLDRIDVNGNYEPSNCRWATRSEQSKNTRKHLLNSINVALDEKTGKK